MGEPFPPYSQYAERSQTPPSSYTTKQTWTASGTSTPASASTTNVLGPEQVWRYDQMTPSPPPPAAGSKSARIKSPASHGALAAALSSSGHAKLHKRGGSVSSVHSASSPIHEPRYRPTVSTAPATPPVGYDDIYTPSSPSSASKSKAKIKPFLRKLNQSEKNPLDLSRSAAENEGLGIYTASTMSGGTRSGTETPPSSGRRGYHHRTMSGASQVSTTTVSNLQRPGAQYVHPMRQTPRPYTPPLARSYQPFLMESEVSSAQGGVTATSGYPHHSLDPAAPSSYAPLPPPRTLPPPLHIRTTSAPRLTSSSQTNLPGTPSSLRRNTDRTTAPDNMQSSARTSLESAFRMRSRSNITSDPASQALAIQALRQQFNEKEAAKDLRAQQAEAKARERVSKKREKREMSERRKSEAEDRKRAKSITSARARSAAPSEKSPSNPHANDFGRHVDPECVDSHTAFHNSRRRGRGETATGATKAVSSQWSLFWFKVKTMWLRWKRKILS
ncbi:MAG: hypothetical protein FRX48_01928 [Lasallia pustulata]|uniref:Uncharacterized protein n=1 Tax=Lasallia pustulata TaxID=136370 RepID=A0A5M8Q1E9_9LECA|nr:MAG: hypothetical protein FRX48_01928 [Lasallia pustulata]